MKNLIVVMALLLCSGCTYSLQQSCYSDGVQQDADTPKTVTPSTDLKVPASIIP